MEPGWAENRWKTHKLLDGLAGAGGTPVQRAADADVLITHSAGGHVLPAGIKARLVVLISPTYVLDRPFFVSIFLEYVMDSVDYFRRLLIYPWLLKNLYYVFFGLFHPIRTVRIYQQVRQPLTIDGLKGNRILLIRNENDFFSSPQIKKLAQEQPNVKYVELPGRHDNVWIEPQPYVDLILKEL